jgi:hypothetical protein
MVVGITGLFLFFVIVPSIVAFVLGLVAASQIKKSSGRQTGLGMARAGWILGLLGILGAIALYSAVIAFYDEERAVFDLEPGDCVEIADFDDPGQQTIHTVPVVDCDAEHTGEVVGIVELNPDRDRPFPPESELFSEAYVRCRDQFADYAGFPLEGTDYDVGPIVTDETAWRAERGAAVCIAVHVDGDELDEPIGN